MLRVYSCLTVDHDWRLVALAVIMCFLASAVAISLFHRAQATIERTRIAWLGLDAVVAGGGIWATHFIAMLAYDPGIGAGYNLVVTILSLLIAMLVTGVGLGIALLFFGRWTAVLGGAVVGGGIAAMHYTGMMALEVPGRITWLPNLVVVSVVLGIAFGALSVYFAARRDDWLNTLIAIFLLTFAIVGTHFTGMGAVVIMPDPTRVNGATFVSPASLSLVIAGVAAIILGICLAVALSDRQSKEKLRQQKLLLDTALENMSQGLCMFDADGNIALFNERYAKLMGLPADGSRVDPCSNCSSAGKPLESLPTTRCCFLHGCSRRRAKANPTPGSCSWRASVPFASSNSRCRAAVGSQLWRTSPNGRKLGRKSPTWHITMRLPAWQIATNWSKNWKRGLLSFR
jgi:NO-binding membrane sensor protein with MHYT domain